MRQLPLGVRIPDRAVFATFLPARNQQAVEHLARLSRGELSGTAWVCGAGTGKTHLLQAACVQASERMRAAYLPLLELSTLGVDILDGIRDLECLCLDDLDAVIGKSDWERALFGIFREIEDRAGRLIVSASTPPALASWSLPDLGSRMCASAVFQLRALDEAEQQEALRLRAQVRGVELSEETSRWLQRHFSRDIRALYELLDTLDEAALVAQRRLTVPFIRSVLRERQLTPER